LRHGLRRRSDPQNRQRHCNREAPLLASPINCYLLSFALYFLIAVRSLTSVKKMAGQSPCTTLIFVMAIRR
jgi:hypothetical protein